MNFPFKNCQGCKRRRERLERWWNEKKKALGIGAQELKEGGGVSPATSSQKGSGHVQK